MLAQPSPLMLTWDLPPDRVPAESTALPQSASGSPRIGGAEKLRRSKTRMAARINEDQDDPALVDPLDIASLTPLKLGELIALLVRERLVAPPPRARHRARDSQTRASPAAD